MSKSGWGEDVPEGLDIEALADVAEMEPDALHAAIEASPGVRRLAYHCQREQTIRSARRLLYWAQMWQLGVAPVRG